MNTRFMKNALGRTFYLYYALTLAIPVVAGWRKGYGACTEDSVRQGGRP